VPQIVKVPVASVPAPPVLAPPHEWVYDLRPGDSPDKIGRYTRATIVELEGGISERDAILDSYRQAATAAPAAKGSSHDGYTGYRR
jgi:hypothetical protein